MLIASNHSARWGVKPRGGQDALQTSQNLPDALDAGVM